MRQYAWKIFQSVCLFHFSSQTNLNQAEKFFKKAIELGLNMDMDLAVAKLNLAGIALSRRRKMEATNLINEVKKLDKQGMLKEQITMMKEQLKRLELVIVWHYPKKCVSL